MSDSELEEDAKRFILYSPKHHGDYPLTDDWGQIVGEGSLGRISADNVYLYGYANYPGEKRPRDLEIGEVIEGVRYKLSGEHGVYDLYRVR